MTEQTLKPCLCCDSEKVEYHNGWPLGVRPKADLDGRKPSVTCEDCGIGMSLGHYGYGISDEVAEAETIEAWNTRAPDPLREGVEKLLESWKGTIWTAADAGIVGYIDRELQTLLDNTGESE